MNSTKKYMFILLLIAAVMLSFSQAYAADAKIYRVTNGRGTPASDLHVTFTGTGGNITTVVLTNPEGCPDPAIPSNGAVTNTVVLEWGDNCVDNEEYVTIKVSTTTDSSLAFSKGFWTDITHPTDPGIGPVGPNDIRQTGIPSLTQWGLIALLTILAGIATWVVLKRKRMVTA